MKKLGWIVVLSNMLTWTSAALGQDVQDNDPVTASDDGRPSSFNGAYGRSVSFAVPGFHGIEPQLGLSYNSAGGSSGLFGVGWSFSGFSVIERAGFGGQGAPRYDDTDAFMLDGEELIACQPGSVSPSCTTGGTHSTEIESYGRIRFDPENDRWEIWSSNGVKATYAHRFDPVPGDADTFRYGLSSVEDTLGNTTTYNWWCDVAATVVYDCMPSSVTYNGVTVELIRFVRTDAIHFATGKDVPTQRRFLIGTIDVRRGLDRSAAYALDYVPSPLTARSLLTSVQRWGRDGVGRGASLPETRFSYRLDTLDESLQGGLWLTGWVTACGAGKPVTGDFNGDGRTDLGCYNKVGNVFHVALSNGSGFGALTNWSSPLCPTGPSKPGLAVGDFNGDGRDDVACYRATDGLTHVALSAGAAFGVPTPWDTGHCVFENRNVALAAIDVNADGRTDLACRDSSTGSGATHAIWVGVSNGSSFDTTLWRRPTLGAPRMFVGYADFNGDGRTDIWWHSTADDRFYVRISTGGAWADGLWHEDFNSRNTYLWTSCEAGSARTADFNGDGLADILCSYRGNGEENAQANAQTTQVWLSRGNAFYNMGLSAGTTVSRVPLDMNGDGRADLVQTDAAPPFRIRVRASLGASFDGPTLWRWPSTGSCAAGNQIHGDFNGDSKLDIACLRGTPLEVRVNISGDPEVPGARDIITSVRTGMGLTTVTYGVSTDPAFVASNTNNPPVQQIVTSITSTELIHNQSSTTSY